MHAGEVVGIAGVAGNGQQEFFDALSGERLRRRRGDDRRSTASRSAAAASTTAAGSARPSCRRSGSATAPCRASACRRTSCSPATAPARTSRAAYVIDRGAAREVEERVGERFDVRRSGADPKASALSGGNLQKFIMGREIDRTPGILVVNQPTWGVDAGAARTIRQALVDLARAGSAVLMISQDLDEIFEIADRIAVLSDGRLSPAYPAETMTADQIGLLMGGVHHGHDGLAAEEAQHAA